MLSSGKNHRDLVAELNSKTFGNRWVAAYELSKYLASSKIPPQDVPWVVENLIQVYDQSVDARTRNFVVLALGTLKHPMSAELMNKAVNDEDSQVKFNAIVGLGNLEKDSKIDWENLKAQLTSTSDEGVKQAIIFTMATHKIEGGELIIKPLMGASERMVRYAAATALIYYNPLESNKIIEEIFALPYDQFAAGQLNGSQAEVLKLNVLSHIEKASAVQLSNLVQNLVEKDSNIQVSTKAKQVLNLLKK
jgi:HEAT repeat protein